MDTISVIIPVFRESDILEDTIKRFLKDGYRRKEIIVAIDEPTESSVETSKRFGKRVRFLMNERRLGKSRALNNAVGASKGDILLFFDSDNRISGRSNRTLSRLEKGMRNKDLAEFKTDVITDSKLSEIVRFDYLNASFTSMLFSRFVKKKPIMGGMAIAVRRSVFSELGGFRDFVSEDMDFSWRAFKKNKSYTHIDGVQVLTKSPSNMKDWFVQRKRWSVGTAEWFKRDRREITKTFIKNSHVTFPSMLVVFPPMIMGIVGMLLSESLLEELFILAVTLLPLKFLSISPFSFAIISSVVFFKSILIFLLSFSVSLSLMYASSRMMRHSFNFLYFLAYYFLYSPVMMFMYFYGFFSVIVLRSTKLSDWKV